MTEHLNDIRRIIADQTAPITTRKAAAEHYIDATVDSVQIPAADDSEVLARMQPQDNAWMVELGLSVEPLRKAVRDSGQSIDGYSVEQSQRYVQAQRRVQAVRKVAADSSTHELVRLAACQWLLTNACKGHWRMNGYTPVILLDKFKTGDEAAQL